METHKLISWAHRALWSEQVKINVQLNSLQDIAWVMRCLYYIHWFIWCKVRSPDQLIHDKHVQKPEHKKPSLQADTPTPSMDTFLIKYLLLVTGKTAHGQNGRKWITFKERDFWASFKSTEYKYKASLITNTQVYHLNKPKTLSINLTVCFLRNAPAYRTIIGIGR